MVRASVVMLPGFQGRADQPILVRLAQQLEPLGFRCIRLAPPRFRLEPQLKQYVDWLEQETAGCESPLVLVGRSFGGRLAIRLAARKNVSALMLLGFPLRPPGKPRPLDEEALQRLQCPTWVAQGTQDALGPMAVLRRVVKDMPNVTIHAVSGAGHQFGGQERETLAQATSWLDQSVR